MFKTDIRLAGPEERWINPFDGNFNELIKPGYSPSPGNLASGRVNELNPLMPRKPEMHEPLPVERSNEILQQLDPPLVDLDQFVEG